MGDVALFTCILSGNAHIRLPYRDRSKELMATAITITDAMAETAIAATAAQAKPRDSDPFRKGDFVVYPAHGLGTVDQVGREQIGGHSVNLIRICFSENRMTPRIPIAKARAVGLRRIAIQEAFDDVWQSLSVAARQRRRLCSISWPDSRSNSVIAGIGCLLKLSDIMLELADRCSKSRVPAQDR